MNLLGFGGKVTSATYLEEQPMFTTEETQEYKQKNSEETKQILNYTEEKIDMVLAHYPPYTFFDKVNSTEDNPMNNQHAGFKGYKTFIEQSSASLFICGHMHEYQGKQEYEDTTIISTGPAYNGEAAIVTTKNKEIDHIQFIK